MTTIRGGSAPGIAQGDLPVRLSRGAHPTGLAASGVTRRPRPKLPVAADRHPGRRPSRLVAPPQGGKMSRSVQPHPLTNRPLLTVAAAPSRAHR